MIEREVVIKCRTGSRQPTTEICEVVNFDQRRQKVAQTMIVILAASHSPPQESLPPCVFDALDEIMTRRLSAINKILIIAGLFVVIGATAVGTTKAYWDQAVPLAGMAINYVRSWSAPSGTTTTELAAGSKDTAAATPSPASAAPSPSPAAADWPSYNKTLTSERYSQLSRINAINVSNLRVLCTYDTKQYTSFETGLIMVNGALIGTTEHDIFSLDPANCHENWRTHEDYKPASLLAVNRGAAYMDGLFFRGTEDGRVLAYDFKTGKRVWETTIADPKLGPGTT